MKINLNDTVKVKLTDHGRAVHFATFDRVVRHPDHRVTYTPPTIDAEGYSKFQLWHLMHDFGRYTGLGTKACFENNDISIPRISTLTHYSRPIEYMDEDAEQKIARLNKECDFYTLKFMSLVQAIMLVTSDAYACTFQTMAQYRKAVLVETRKVI